MFQPAYTMLGHNWKENTGTEGIEYVRAVRILGVARVGVIRWMFSRGPTCAFLWNDNVPFSR
jgi:hypothetical protein